MGMHGFSKMRLLDSRLMDLVVSIPDGDAWVFKVSTHFAAAALAAVSIPDGDAWVFKARRYGGDWNAVKPPCCERLVPMVILHLRRNLSQHIIPHFLPHATAQSSSCERLPGFYPMLCRSQLKEQRTEN